MATKRVSNDQILTVLNSLATRLQALETSTKVSKVPTRSKVSKTSKPSKPAKASKTKASKTTKVQPLELEVIQGADAAGNPGFELHFNRRPCETFRAVLKCQDEGSTTGVELNKRWGWSKPQQMWFKSAARSGQSEDEILGEIEAIQELVELENSGELK